MPDIKPSPELTAIVRRWNGAMTAKDGATLTNFFSDSGHLHYLGTATDELWHGSVLRDGFADHIGELPEFDQTELLIEAYECGPIGWSIWEGELKFSGIEKPARLRVTMVFALENGSWKIVQHHASNPSSNIEVIGIEHTALDALVSAAKDGFRQDQSEGMASIMFTDIVNSSEIANVLGDRLWARTVQAHLDDVGQLVRGNGGRVVKSLGDGTMASYSSARAALRAAIEVQQRMNRMEAEPQLQLRVGVHTGDVIQTEDDFFGTVVNKAARITAHAKPGEIRLSEATRIMVGGTGDFAFSEREIVALRGLAGEHVLYRLNF